MPELTKEDYDETIISGMRNCFTCLYSIFFLSMLFSVSSCSLDYSVAQAENNGSPEFVFSDATYTRIEDQRKTITLEADVIEQYISDNTMYGRNLSFQAFDKNGDISVKGSCSLFSGNADRGEYYFLDDVELESFEHSLFLKADNVYWNDTTDQLISSSNAPVTIRKGGDAEVFITGNEFSASSFSNSFKFSGPVSGTIETGDDDESTD